MHVLADQEMQRFVRGSGGVGALLLVGGVLGLGLWAVSLGGLLLVLAGLVVLAAVEAREMDEAPSPRPERVRAGPSGGSAFDGPVQDEEAQPAAADAPAARLGFAERTRAQPEDHVEPVTPVEPVVVAASTGPSAPRDAKVSPLERLAMALPPAERPDQASAAAAPTRADHAQPPAIATTQQPHLTESADGAEVLAAAPEAAEVATAPAAEVPSQVSEDRAVSASDPVEEPPRPLAEPVDVRSGDLAEEVVASVVPTTHALPPVVARDDDPGGPDRAVGVLPDGEAGPAPVPSSSTPDGPELVVVTFRLPRAVGAQVAAVVGEFNGWSPDAHPMEPDDDEFVARIPLEPGRAYRFRYLLDGERWENDWSADGYVPNEFGGDDSLVDVQR